MPGLSDEYIKKPFSDFDPSKTYKVKVGCGNIYITIVYNKDGSIHRVRLPRNTKFNCSLIFRDGMAKEATYKARRDMPQLIKDFKGRKPDLVCDNYNINCQAYSCRDAIAKVFEYETKEKITQQVA